MKRCLLTFLLCCCLPAVATTAPFAYNWNQNETPASDNR